MAGAVAGVDGLCGLCGLCGRWPMSPWIACLLEKRACKSRTAEGAIGGASCVMGVHDGRQDEGWGGVGGGSSPMAARARQAACGRHWTAPAMRARAASLRAPTPPSAARRRQTPGTLLCNCSRLGSFLAGGAGCAGWWRGACASAQRRGRRSPGSGGRRERGET